MSRNAQLFYLFWCGITGSLLFFLFWSPEEEFTASARIGKLVNTTGVIRVKPDARILWRETAPGYQLGYNDSIATSANSSAMLQILDLPPLKLGANSRLTIKTSARDQGAIIIDLEKGLIATAKKTPRAEDNIEDEKPASPEQKSAPEKLESDSQTPTKIVDNQISSEPTEAPQKAITITAGEKVFTLGNKKSQLTLFKPEVNSQATVVKAKGNINVAEPGSVRPQLLESVDRQKELSNTIEKAATQTIEQKAKIIQKQKSLKNVNKVAGKSKKFALLTTNSNASAKLSLDLETIVANPEPIVPKKINLMAELDLDRLINDVIPEDFLPVIRLPRIATIGWVIGPLAKIKKTQVGIPISPPRTKVPNSLRWLPFIGAIAPGSKQKQLVMAFRGRSALSNQDIKLDLNKAKKVVEESSGANPEINFTVIPGVNLMNSANKITSNALGQIHPIKIRTLNSVRRGPASLSIAKWAFTTPKSKVLWQGSFTKKATITVANGSEIIKLKQLMHAENFSVDQRKKSLSGKGVFFIKQFQIIAQVTGEYEDPENIRRLINKFQAEYAFEGEFENYLGGMASLEKLAKSRALPTKLYTLANRRFNPIELSFFQRNPAALKFLAKRRAVFFRKSVQLFFPK